MNYESLGIYDDNRNVVPHARISWDEYFMSMAYLIAKRSHDSQSQHGTCLVRDNRIISTGFNGFPPGSPDHIIPNIRPWKYVAMNHAEESAIFDAARRGVSIEGCRAYVSGHPCCYCCRKLISVGVLDWIIGKTGFQQTDQEKDLTRFWLEKFNVKVRVFEGDILLTGETSKAIIPAGSVGIFGDSRP